MGDSLPKYNDIAANKNGLNHRVNSENAVDPDNLRPSMSNGVPPLNMDDLIASGYSIQPMNYVEMMNYRRMMIQQRKEYQEKQLREIFSVKYAIFHSVILIVLGIAVFCIQVIMIKYKTSLYYIGSGVWIGIFYVLLATLALLLIRYRNLWLFTLTMILHMIGFMLSLCGLLVVNAIAYSRASNSYGLNSPTSDLVVENDFYHSFNVFFFRADDINNAYKYSALHIPMIVIGGVGGVVCVIFFILLNYRVNCIYPNGTNVSNQPVLFYNRQHQLNRPISTISNGDIQA